MALLALPTSLGASQAVCTLCLIRCLRERGQRRRMGVDASEQRGRWLLVQDHD